MSERGPVVNPPFTKSELNGKAVSIRVHNPTFGRAISVTGKLIVRTRDNEAETRIQVENISFTPSTGTAFVVWLYPEHMEFLKRDESGQFDFTCHDPRLSENS